MRCASAASMSTRRRFSEAMERQKAEARKHWSGSGDAATETIWFEIKDKAGATDFLGYDTETAEGVIQALVRDGKQVETATSGDQVDVVVNQTPFYGESGGQMGDQGTISGEGYQLEVSDTQKRGEGLFVHKAKVVSGTVSRAPWRSWKSIIRGAKIRANHSATHLLHEALREVLGTHVAQKGSLVAPDRLGSTSRTRSR
jgi:alanyl-tRNA synthetase